MAAFAFFCCGCGDVVWCMFYLSILFYCKDYSYFYRVSSHRLDHIWAWHKFHTSGFCLNTSSHSFCFSLSNIIAPPSPGNTLASPALTNMASAFVSDGLGSGGDLCLWWLLLVFLVAVATACVSGGLGSG